MPDNSACAREFPVNMSRTGLDQIANPNTWLTPGRLDSQSTNRISYTSAVTSFL
jgi:hypothetical protein